jgi:DNA repair protein RecO (recombination protein O)
MLCWAYPERIALRRRNGDGAVLMRHGGGARLASGDPLCGAEALAIAVQSSVQLLALGGYALPLQCCARTGAALQPPVGDWSWRCSFFAAEGLAIGAIAGAQQLFNASELALLQRLTRPAPPRRRDGGLLGPVPVWLRLLALIEAWSREHAGRSPRAFRLLRNALEPMTATGSTLEPPSP